MEHRGYRTLVTTGLARVEGEGSMYVRVAGGLVEEVRLDIYEPPRFFEAFLRGRSYTEPPDLTARICGICPIAYQTSACQAIESACGATLPGGLAGLRRLLNCGEWISSHACTSTCCTRPTSSDTRAPSRWHATTARRRRPAAA